MSESAIPRYRLAAFEGPLDLLLHLIEKNKIDIADIPVAELTDQYLDYIAGLGSADMDIASDFLLMAATLLAIKSRLLLPKRESARPEDDDDPRTELVLRLLEYRRCKLLAGALGNRQKQYADCLLKLPETPQRLGLQVFAERQILTWDAFLRACKRLSAQNRVRFQDLSSRFRNLLERERISLRSKAVLIWDAVRSRSRVFFNELFPADRTSRTEQVTGFLALLELLRLNRVRATQERPFDVILLEVEPGASDEPLDDTLLAFEERVAGRT